MRRWIVCGEPFFASSTPSKMTPTMLSGCFGKAGSTEVTWPSKVDPFFNSTSLPAFTSWVGLRFHRLTRSALLQIKNRRQLRKNDCISGNVQGRSCGLRIRRSLARRKNRQSENDQNK